MKKLIQKCQDGSKASFWRYMIPIEGTRLAINDAIESGDPMDWGLAALSGAGDVGTILGLGPLFKSLSMAAKARTAASLAKPAYNTMMQAAKDLGTARGTVKGVSKMVESNADKLPVNTLVKAIEALDVAAKAIPLYSKDLTNASKLYMMTPLYHLQNAMWLSMPMFTYQVPKVLNGIHSIVSNEHKK